MAKPAKQGSAWPVLQGGVSPLSAEQRRAVSAVSQAVRDLSSEDAEMLVRLIEEFRRDGYLGRLRSFDLPAVKVLAEVISGWEEDGVYEFARAWVSTLVARQDGFTWSDCDPGEKQRHRQRIEAEMVRRGLAWPSPEKS